MIVENMLENLFDIGEALCPARVVFSSKRVLSLSLGGRPGG
jgi:hypothetical protein